MFDGYPTIRFNGIASFDGRYSNEALGDPVVTRTKWKCSYGCIVSKNVQSTMKA